MNITDLFVPLIIASIFIFGLIKKVITTEEFTSGAKENLITAFEILPSLILLMTAVGMFMSSGAPEMISRLISPVTEFIGFPDECVCLSLVRPVTGSGSLAVLENILSDCSPDSFSGRVASVLMSSTETTFYTITVYFASIRQKPDYRIYIASMTADFAGFVFSSLFVRLFF